MHICLKKYLNILEIGLYKFINNFIDIILLFAVCWQYVINLLVELALENWFVRGGCSRAYIHIFKFTIK